MKDYWRDAGVRIENIDHTKIDCYSEVVKFRGCIAGINALGDFAEPKVRLIPQSLLTDNSIPHGAIIQSFGSLVLVENTNSVKEKNLRQLAEKVKVQFYKLKDAEEIIYKKIIDELDKDQKTDSFVSFETIAKELIAKIKADPKNQDSLAFIAARHNNAMLAVRDAHAYEVPIAYMQDRAKNADKSYFGIGIKVQGLNDNMVVAEVQSGGAAEKSGLINKNDIILQVDGKDIKGLAPMNVSELIRSDRESEVSITLLRDETEITVTLIREKIEIPNVQAKVLEDINKKKIGYIKLATFAEEQACSRIASAIEDLKKKNVTGLILDLRSNGGGLLDQALCVGGLFLGEETIVGVKEIKQSFGIENSIKYFRALPVQLGKKVVKKTDLPLVTLIDGGSASASEIVAGALQHHQRAWILGEISYGKGSVQKLKSQPLRSEDIYLAKTEERFYQPNGKTNQGVGIHPDITVPFKPGATEDERFTMRELDAYPNALAPEGNLWTQSRPRAAQKLQSCLDKKKLAEKKYEELKNNKLKLVDYQLLVAQEAFSCGVR